jgi:hypothetical protein
LETWSSAPVTLNNSVLSYDFTTAKSKAYGNNQFDLLDGKFAIFNGDIDQNGIIDSLDLAGVEESSTFFTTGYHVADVTGDSVVESSDYSIIDNNVKMGISLIRP